MDRSEVRLPSPSHGTLPLLSRHSPLLVMCPSLQILWSPLVYSDMLLPLSRQQYYETSNEEQSRNLLPMSTNKSCLSLLHHVSIFIWSLALRMSWVFYSSWFEWIHPIPLSPCTHWGWEGCCGGRERVGVPHFSFFFLLHFLLFNLFIAYFNILDRMMSTKRFTLPLWPPAQSPQRKGQGRIGWDLTNMLSCLHFRWEKWICNQE